MKRQLVELTDAVEHRNREAFDQHADTDNRGHQTRGEIEADLQARGLTPEEAATLYARQVLGQSIREIARETGKAHGTVANIERRAKAKLRAGTAAPNATAGEGLPGLLAHLRAILDSERQAAWHYDGSEEMPEGKSHTFTLRSRLRTVSEHWPETMLARAVVSCVREYPQTLAKGTGWDWPAKLAEIIAAGKYGTPSERKAAREALALLTKGRTGNPVEYAPHPVKAGFSRLCLLLAILQREYRATVGAGTVAERLAALQQSHGAELAGFDPSELQRILTRDPLAAAVELAATATGISADYWRDLAKREAREIEAGLSPRRRPS
jgi:transcriptional regulator with XRE-family HTH domain